MSQATLDAEALAEVFPFHLLVGEDRRVLEAGPAWERVGGPPESMADLRLISPDVPLCQLRTCRGRLLQFEWGPVPLRLRGQLVPSGEHLLFLLSPVLRSFDELERSGLRRDDLALHDPSLDLMTLTQGLTNSLEDARTLAQRLNHRRKQAEQARRQAEVAAEARYRFLAAMSHEIRTPLNGVLGMAQLLELSELDATQRRQLDALSVSGRALLDIINDILDFSRIDSGKLGLDSAPFDPAVLLQEVLTMVAPRAQMVGLELAWWLAPGLPAELIGDGGRVRQILVNLLGNAVKFTAQGHVVARMAYQDGQLVCQVQDSGVGMSPEQLQRIFEPFTQADGSITRRFGGTGLGLSISRGLTQAMDGELSVTSEPGKGSTFTVRLPMAVSQAAREPLDWGGPVALVLEQTLTREALASTLRHMGAQVTAVSEASALPRRTWGWVFSERPVLAQTHRAARIADFGGGGCVSGPVGPRQLRELVSRDCARRQQRATPERFEMRVLVAEDNPLNQMLLRSVLERFGVQVRMAGDGIEAVAIALAEPFDLVLMDCQMPQLSGFDATRRIRRALGEALPIVALTASVLQEDRDQAQDAGMDDFLAKPVDLEALRALLARYST